MQNMNVMSDKAKNDGDDAPQGRVLVAEDNPMNLLLATRLLQRMGFEVLGATSGQAAIEHYRQGPWDLILMDCHMPDIDGIQATRTIRQLEKFNHRTPTPIIGISASANLAEKAHCRAAGMSFFLHKPFTFKELQDCVLRILQHDRTPTLAEGTASEEENQMLISEAPNGLILDPDMLEQIRQLETHTNPLLLSQIIDHFLNYSPNWIEGIKEAIALQNPTQLAFNAHTLKSGSANLGARIVAQHSKELEEMGRSGNIDAAYPLFCSLLKAHAQASAALKKELERTAA